MGSNPPFEGVQKERAANVLAMVAAANLQNCHDGDDGPEAGAVVVGVARQDAVGEKEPLWVVVQVRQLEQARLE